MKPETKYIKTDDYEAWFIKRLSPFNIYTVDSPGATYEWEYHRTDGPAFIGNNGTCGWAVGGRMFFVTGISRPNNGNRYMQWAEAALKFEGIDNPTEEMCKKHLHTALKKYTEAAI